MIVTLVLYVLTMLLNMISTILPNWQIWPQSLLDGLTYFFSTLWKFDFIIPVATLFQVILFMVSFEVVYFNAKIIMKVFNYLRGTGSGLEI